MQRLRAQSGVPEAIPVAMAEVEDCHLGRFEAMASPCSVLVNGGSAGEAEALTRVAAKEALRIERTFSRYRSDNIVHRINHSEGRPVPVDEETAKLLDYAATCHEISGGLFDITSGVLRKVWTFDGSTRVPSPKAVRAVLAFVGWQKVEYDGSSIRLPAGMQIDLGGIGKEYAVDRAAALLAERTERAFLVNFGGDLYASGVREGKQPWGVGIEDPTRTEEAVLYRVELCGGGLATSGDARRFVIHEGRRLGHILDPRTGWPVEGAPRAITVIASSCLEAGTLSTLAYLQGSAAESFLKLQKVQYQLI